MSDNFNEENLKRILAELPKEASEAELFALFQTIFDAYAVEPDDRVNIISNMLSASFEQVEFHDHETPLH